MKRGILSKFLSLSVFLSSLLSGAFSLAEFCVQSYNAYGPAYSLNLKGRTNLLLSMFEEKGLCEIVTFQEVWRDSHIDHLLVGLDSLNPDFSFYHANNPFEGVSTGLLTATTFPVSAAESLVYYEYPNGIADWFRGQLGVKKALGTVRANISESEKNQDVWVVNTHLHHSSQVIRLAQIVELGEYLNHDNLRALPLILAGDFNFKPDSLEAELLKVYSRVIDTHTEVHGEYGLGEATYDVENPLSWGGDSRIIDYVFYRNSDGYGLRPTSSEIYPKDYNGQFMSDHYGRWVSFRLAESEALLEAHENEKAVDVLKRALRVLRSEKSPDFDGAVRILERKIATYN